MREGELFIGRGEAVRVDAFGGREAETLADGGDLAQLLLALRVEVLFEVAFKLRQGANSRAGVMRFQYSDRAGVRPL